MGTCKGLLISSVMNSRIVSSFYAYAYTNLHTCIYLHKAHKSKVQSGDSGGLVVCKKYFFECIFCFYCKPNGPYDLKLGTKHRLYNFKLHSQNR